MELGDSGLRYRLRRALRQIGEQHRRLHELQDRIGAALAEGDRGELRDAFVRYRHAIGAHFELEDGVFFPALHGLHPESQRDLEDLSHEHGDLLETLRRLAALIDAPEAARFGAAFAAFGDQFARHEAREEGVVSGLAEGSG
jgi:hemerythrin-like domain-containing protein